MRWGVSLMDLPKLGFPDEASSSRGLFRSSWCFGAEANDRAVPPSDRSTNRTCYTAERAR